MAGTRIESDSMGSLEVPARALYGAQTQRAINNFAISTRRFPPAFIQAVAIVKWAAASANESLGLLDNGHSTAIMKAAAAIAGGDHFDQFPLDIYQTGSGTSTNMNVNEVIAHLASAEGGIEVHPNDHVNMSQSSNDVIPTSIHVSAASEIEAHLKPSLAILAEALSTLIEEHGEIAKTGRTHLMDAVPVTLGQEFGAWREQVMLGIDRLDDGMKRLRALPLGGTAVGSGINAPSGFAGRAIKLIGSRTGIRFTEKHSRFEGIAAQDAAVEMSGHLNTIAAGLMKIANDLRWMNSGPLAGLGEISLPAIQPGSSIMPGKVNPVIPEAVAMVCAQVMGNHTTITIAGQSGNFQLNTMLPLIASNLLESIALLANASTHLAEKALNGLTVNRPALAEPLLRNPILVTGLNREIGYDRAAAIAKKAYQERRPILDVAREETDLDEALLRELLDPARQAAGPETE